MGKHRKHRVIEIEGIATAMEPIAHGGDKTGGTVTEFRRVRIQTSPGVFEDMPQISANSIAGILRDNCARWCMDQIDYEVRDLRVFDLLTGGGKLTKVSNKKSFIDLFEEKELRRLFPLIGLFGGSVGNRILDGLITVSNWTPICAELKTALPEEYHDLADEYSIADLLTEMYFTRRDDKKRRDMQQYIAAEVIDAYQSEEAERTEEQQALAAGEATSMRYGTEALAVGTMFHVSFKLYNPSDVELGCFFGGFGYFYENPKIGARGRRGMGRVRLDLKQYRLAGPARVEEPMALQALELASQHMQDNREQIVQMLESL